MLLMYQHQIINEMTWQQKSNFIQKDPVTCARSFEHIVQLFIHDILKSDAVFRGSRLHLQSGIPEKLNEI